VLSYPRGRWGPVKIAFPYENVPPVGVPDANLTAVVGPRDQTATATADRLIRDALEHPLANPRLRELGIYCA